MRIASPILSVSLVVALAALAGCAALGIAPLSAGFVLARERIAVVTENELYASQVRQRTQREVKRATARAASPAPRVVAADHLAA